MIISTDPDAQAMERAIRYPGYSVVRARNSISKRWIIRVQDGTVTHRGAVGRHVGAMRGYGTEIAAWRVVASLQV